MKRFLQFCQVIGVVFVLSPVVLTGLMIADEYLPSLAAATVSPVVIPTVQGVAGAPLVINGDAFPDGIYYVQIEKKNGALKLSPIQSVGLDGNPTTGSLPPVDNDPPEDPIPNTAIEKVKAAFAAEGLIAVFNQQVALLKAVIEIPDSFTTRPLAFNHINGILEKALGEYASPYWEPWLIPLVTAVEEAEDFDTIKTLASEARASLEGV
jgi:hypothetical protein